MLGEVRLRVSYVIIFALMVCAVGYASAQQAGTADYNSRYLPGHGVGDTRGVQRWGAMAKGKGDAIGWITDANTESEAADRAMSQCNFDPSRPCSLEYTFVNSCAVFAASKRGGYSSYGGRSSLAAHRKVAMKKCGSDCRIYREGCSLPDH